MAEGGKFIWAKWLLWTLRALAAAMIVVGGTIAYLRLHRTGEQIELTRYVQIELPALSAEEGEVMKRLQPLNRAGLSAEAARSLLVDDEIPRLIRLRKRAASVEAQTAAVKALRIDYLGWIDKLVEACRTSVRAIDDPQGDAVKSLAEVRRKFAEADAAAASFAEHVRRECIRCRLAPPVK